MILLLTLSTSLSYYNRGILSIKDVVNFNSLWILCHNNKGRNVKRVYKIPQNWEYWCKCFKVISYSCHMSNLGIKRLINQFLHGNFLERIGMDITLLKTRKLKKSFSGNFCREASSFLWVDPGGILLSSSGHCEVRTQNPKLQWPSHWQPDNKASMVGEAGGKTSADKIHSLWEFLLWLRGSNTPD